MNLDMDSDINFLINSKEGVFIRNVKSFMVFWTNGLGVLINKAGIF